MRRIRKPLVSSRKSYRPTRHHLRTYNNWVRIWDLTIAIESLQRDRATVGVSSLAEIRRERNKPITVLDTELHSYDNQTVTRMRAASTKWVKSNLKKRI